MSPFKRPVGKEGLADPLGEDQPVLLKHLAAKRIQSKWDSLQGAPGVPKMAGDAGVIEIGDGFCREYANGRIYFEPDLGTFWVHGAIGDRYAELGGPSSWLGLPTTDELDVDGGKVILFQNGAIYWWPDTGPRDINNVVVHYTGVHCFGETDVDGASNSDEPYATIGVAGPDGTKGTFRSQIYEDVHAGEGRFQVIEIYRGRPRGLLINSILQEHSGGDTEVSRTAIREAVDKGGAALAAAATLIPAVGPVLGPLASAVHQILKGDIINALNSFVENTLGFADRPLGSDVIELTPKQMVILATRPEGHAQFNEIPWRFETALLSRFGATYKVYFNIFPG